MIPTGINVFRCAQGKVKMIVSNPAWRKLMGFEEAYADEQWIEQKTYEAVHPDDEADVDNAVRTLFSDAHAAEVTYRSKNILTGEYIWICA